MSKSPATTANVSTPITIQGLVFAAPAPFVEGHVLTAIEATQLNRTFAENLRNNFAGTVKKATADGAAPDHDVLKNEFALYASTYVFGAVRASSKTPVDPVEKEAHKIAKDHISTALRAKGLKPASLPDGKMDEYIAQYLSSEKGKKVYSEAKSRVSAATAGASEALAALGID